MIDEVMRNSISLTLSKKLLQENQENIDELPEMPEDSKRSDSREKSLVRGTNKVRSGR